MRRIQKALLLAMGLVMVAACAPQAPDTAADEAALKADPGAWMAAYNAGNADDLANLYTEDAVLMPPGGPAVVGRAAIREFAAADISKSQAAGLTFNNEGETGLDVSGDMGWLSGNYSVTDASGATADKGKFLSVYRRDNGDWQLIRDTWNSDMVPAEAAPSVPADAAAVPESAPTQ